MGTHVAMYLRSMLLDVMRRFRWALEPLEDDLLLEFSTFVEAGAGPTAGTEPGPSGTPGTGGMSFSSVIRGDRPARFNVGFSVELRRRDGRGEETRLCQTYVKESSVVQVVQTLVACPTWTHAEFVFCQLGLDTVVEKIFSVLRSGSSLPSLDILLNRLYSRFLPVLLCENSWLETVVLNPGALNNLEDAERLALYFMRNSVPRSCTLVVDSARLDLQTWEVALRPLLSSSKNLSLKELVVLEARELAGAGSVSGEVLANLVRCGATLEKLEFRLSCTDLTVAVAKSFAEALAVNRTLKEFRCNCNLVLLKEIVSVFIPDSSGLQANTHLTTLKLFTTLDCPVEDCMTVLSRMLKSNTTLKHVEVALPFGVGSNSRTVWEVRSLKPPRCFENVCTQDMLEVMIRNELRVNIGLQSLVVGCWKLVRVGDAWQMSYGGPCLASELLLLTGEYDVKVKML